ncbi:hypothetical protein ACFVXG_20375 [Kitasatospora sp. NPDC058162]|uniref:hypothetical protein n=1 Tax=Kitasatospora sp. NPDC058162 TaxID=3346362 RepID=UPI0036DA9BAF
MPDTYLTAADLAVEGAHYGVPVIGAGDDDDDDLLAIGDHPPRRVLAACNRYARQRSGLRNPITASGSAVDNIRRGHAQFRRPRLDLDEDPCWMWVMDDCAPDAEHAVPYTLVVIS